MRARRALPFTYAALSAVALGCAAAGLPPGGPVDKKPPVLLSLTPDTNARRVKAKDVVFTFDEIVSERPKGAATLDGIVMISPAESPAVVDWHRNRLTVHPKKGWRANTAYVVTLLPGLADLSGNSLTKPIETVFSTGDVIPSAVVRGAVFDWVAQKPVPFARIEGTVGKDTVLRWLAAADSLGRFALTHVPPSPDLRLRVFADANSNRLLDRRELWDSMSVPLADSARRDFYLFAHDSVAPRLATELALIDSTALRLKFDRPLNPATPFDLSNITLRNRDSTERPVKALYRAGEFDSLATKRKQAYDDSVAKADTTKAGRAARARADSLAAKRKSDSTSAAQIAAIKAAKDTVKREPPPKPSRPAPLSEYVLVFGAPLHTDEIVRLEVRGLVSLDGVAQRPLERTVRGPKPPPPKKDSTATKSGAPRPGAAPPGVAPPGAAKPPAELRPATDTLPARKPTAADSVPAKKPAPGDSLPVKKPRRATR
ncbi:MAG: Ig-like domain-containing protein [Gemmatimonadetes bacterium]|nr:Ig-like domain-containing protein [Gemmatimonadota bacterium]